MSISLPDYCLMWGQVQIWVRGRVGQCGGVMLLGRVGYLHLFYNLAKGENKILNIIKTDGKWAPEAKREGLELILRCFSPLFSISINFMERNLILGRILRKLALQGGTLGYKKNEPVWSKSQ